MKTVYIKTLSLGALIDALRQGEGWFDPTIPRRLGHALDALIPAEDRATSVTVTFLRGSYGYGPDFHYMYEWRVTGYRLPQEGRLAPTTREIVFGFRNAELPRLSNTEDGFVAYAEW